MEPSPKQKAKSIVNKIYQPMGLLGCNTSSDSMWLWATRRAKEQVSEIILIAKTMGELSPTYEFWNNVLNEIDELA